MEYFAESKEEPANPQYEYQAPMGRSIGVASADSSGTLGGFVHRIGITLSLVR